MSKEKILYNQKCSLCNFEINHYKQRSDLNFVDSSQMEDKYLKRLHVVFADDSELSGVDAFLYVWSNTNGYQWLAKIVALPLIKQFSIILYAVISRILFWRFKLSNYK
jgi:predicted DCC family thiol-disulfide oxidoreductase YuxK|tara:strand:+ start:2640 stop:2963 length:324 start_codon:yes stop_codon:yes gene_type:complete